MCFYCCIRRNWNLINIFIKWMKTKENKKQQEHKNIHVCSACNNKQKMTIKWYAIFKQCNDHCCIKKITKEQKD